MSATDRLQGFASDGRRIRDRKYVAVDCDPSGASLTLSHHFSGNATPAPYRADLASGAALKWAASDDRDDALGGAQWVYNDHFDVDGFLTAWVVLHPDEALAVRHEVLDAAAAGDFAEWTSDRAVKFAILGEWVDDPNFSEIARESLGGRAWPNQDALYAKVLEELPDLLRHPERMEGLWRRPYDKLAAEVDLIERGHARVEERPRAHLSVLHGPRELSSRAFIARARGDRMLQAVGVGGGFMYRFRYRPYLKYRIVSRPTTPVHDVGALARELNRTWPTRGERWRTRGWWNRELRLTAPREGRSRLPRTEPEVAVEAVEAALARMDAAGAA